MPTLRNGLALAAVLMMAAGLPSSSASAMPGALPDLSGDWGGSQARLSISSDGGRLDLACASASIAGPLRATGNGGFSASGRYEEFTGGPTLADTAPATVAADFTGQVVGDVMHLRVHAKGAARVQEFTLQRGHRVKLIRCA